MEPKGKVFSPMFELNEDDWAKIRAAALEFIRRHRLAVVGGKHLMENLENALAADRKLWALWQGVLCYTMGLDKTRKVDIQKGYVGIWIRLFKN